MTVAAAKAFGAVPRSKVFVRVQEVEGGKIIGTKSFNVYGSNLEQVAGAIEVQLAHAFGTDDAVEEEEEEAPPAPPKKTIRKKVKR